MQKIEVKSSNRPSISHLVAQIQPQIVAKSINNANEIGRQQDAASRGNPKRRLTAHQRVHLLRRVLVIGAAIMYIATSLSACRDSMTLLQDFGDPSLNFQLYETNLVGVYAGETTVRESPLLAALNNSTTPRNGTLFLETNSTTFMGCTTTAPSIIYEDAFQRSMFQTIIQSTAYNLTFLDPTRSELIMPVIDCTATTIVIGDTTSPKFFYLMRMVNDPDDVYLLTVFQSLQECYITKQRSTGPVAMNTISFINDLRADQVTHHFALGLGSPYKNVAFEVYELVEETPEYFWLLKSIPSNPLKERSKLVLTTNPTGFYLHSLDEQANYVNTLWTLSQDPRHVLSRWEWVGKSVTRDSWAWVHFLHFYYAVNASFSLVVLFVVMFSNYRLGRIWVGDAFVAISSKLWLRSLIVLLSWYLDGFFALKEFVLYNGNVLLAERQSSTYTSVMKADLQSLYLSLVGTTGSICQERIDPTLAMVLFNIAFEARLSITRAFPGMVKTLADLAAADYLLGINGLDPSLPEVSPLRVWTAHELPNPSRSAYAATFLPVFSTLIFVLVYVVIRKTFRYFHPDLARQWAMSSSSARSSMSSRLSSRNSEDERPKLTQFEIASGVELRARFGIVTDYDNYVHIKGLKFVSADGVHTSGFVIANGKFLIPTDSLLSIMAMKVTHVCFRNIYVYDVDGNRVKETARLVYPETIAWTDLFPLNLKVLL
ncbi:hypothetical protein FI667_g14369, partial [Globisporangium splendens]